MSNVSKAIRQLDLHFDEGLRRGKAHWLVVRELLLPTLADAPPYLDELDCSAWEAQEITRAWRNADSLYSEAIERIQRERSRSREGLIRGLGNDAQALQNATAAHARLLTLVEGVHHRKALAERGET